MFSNIMIIERLEQFIFIIIFIFGREINKLVPTLEKSNVGKTEVESSAPKYYDVLLKYM